jgi:hypothetical protein
MKGLKPMGDWRPRPNIERADHYLVAFCGDPVCGLHIIAGRANGEQICEIVMSAEQTMGIVEACQNEMADRAAKKH